MSDEHDCPDCIAAKKHAYSDATTPGFFYTQCPKHREPEPPGETVQPQISADGQKLFDRASQATKEVATWPEWKKGALVNKRAEPQQVIPGVNISWEGITGSIIDRVQLTHEDAVNEEVTQYLRKWFDPLIERLGAAEQRADNAEEQLDDLCDALSGAGLIQDPESANLDIILDDLLAERDKLKDQNLILLNNADAFESKWRTLLSQLGAAEQEYGALQSEHGRIVGAMLTERERLRNQLTDAERNVAILTEGCEVWEKRYAELEAERDRLKEALDGRMRVFQEDAAEIKQLEAKVAELEGQCAVYAAQLAANLIKGR